MWQGRRTQDEAEDEGRGEEGKGGKKRKGNKGQEGRSGDYEPVGRIKG